MIVMFFQNMQQKRDVLHFKYLLKDVRNEAGRKYYINDYVPVTVQERRRKEKEVANVAQNTDPPLEVTYQRGKMLIQNEIYHPKVTVPTPKQIVDVNPTRMKHILDMPLVQHGRITQEMSTFEAYTTSVNSYKDIRDLYIKVKLLQPGARHVICAYWIDGAEPHYCKDFCDDGEPSAGRKLLQYMTEKELKCRVIFVARKYGGIRMGPDRFECYRAAADIVVKQDSYNTILKRNQWAPTRNIEESENAAEPQKSAESKKRPASSPLVHQQSRQTNYKRPFRKPYGAKYGPRGTGGRGQYSYSRSNPRGSSRGPSYWGRHNQRQFQLNQTRGRFQPTSGWRGEDHYYDNNYEDWNENRGGQWYNDDARDNQLD